MRGDGAEEVGSRGGRMGERGDGWNLDMLWDGKYKIERIILKNI